MSNKQTLNISPRNQDRIDFLERGIQAGNKYKGDKPDMTNWTYLDVGCNTAEMTLLIHEYNKFAVTECVDVMTTAEFKKAAAPGVLESDLIYRKVRGGNKIPFTAKSVDLITCFQSIHHFQDTLGMLKSINHVGKPGALLYIRDHDADAKDTKLVNYLDAIHVKYGDNPAEIQYRSRKQLTTLLKSAGFKLIEYLDYPANSPNPQATYHAIYVKTRNV